MAAQDEEELFDILDDGGRLARRAQGAQARSPRRRLAPERSRVGAPRAGARWPGAGQRPERRGALGALPAAQPRQGHLARRARGRRVGALPRRRGSRGALREAEEEIGLPLAPRDVVRLGTRRSQDDHAPGIVDRELQDVLLATTRRALEELRPDPREVTALLSLPLGAALRLVRGEVPHASGLARRLPDAAGAVKVEPRDVRLDEFVVARDGYFERALDTISPAPRGRGAGPMAPRLGRRRFLAPVLSASSRGGRRPAAGASRGHRRRDEESFGAVRASPQRAFMRLAISSPALTSA